MVHILDLQYLNVRKTIAAFLVETSVGPVLVETGPYSTFNQLKKEVERCGHKIEDIKHVFLSHIHLDHAGAAWFFAEQGAKIYVHPRGIKHMHDPSVLMSSAKMIYKDMMDSLWGAMNGIPMEQLVSIEHGQAIDVGAHTFQGWHTPGHASHHIAWQTGEILFAGDVAGVRIDNGIVVPPCPPPDIHIEDWVESIALIRKLTLSKIYLTHFGEINDIKIHLESLEAILWDWANWMKPHFENGNTVQETAPLFQKYVKQQLIDAGINKAGLEQYEYANPSWMSVAGLMRYWKKKLVT